MTRSQTSSRTYIIVACVLVPAIKSRERFCPSVGLVNLIILTSLVCVRWALSIAHQQRATDFEPGGVCGGSVFSPPSTCARVQSRIEFMEPGGGLCSNYHKRQWDYRLVPAGTTHCIREHSTRYYVRVYIVFTGTRGSPVEFVWIYECALCDVRMAYLG